MTKDRDDRGDRAFDFLLRLFPRRFRDEYGAEMRRDFRNDRADHVERPLPFWWRIVGGMLTTAPREQVDELLRDLRTAWRSHRRRPVVLATAVLSLAIGIGATTTVFAVLDATFGRGLPGIVEPDRLVNVKTSSPSLDSFQLTPLLDFRALRADNATVDLTGFHGTRMSWTSGDEPEVTSVTLVASNYFDVLGARPALGRVFDPRSEIDHQPEVVLSDLRWRERFGADPAVLGREVVLNGQAMTVVGVMEPGFRGHFVGFNFDFFLPLSMAPVAGLADPADRSERWVEQIGRLRADVTIEQARADFALQAGRLERDDPDGNRGLEIELERYDGHEADLRGGLLVFLIGLLAVSSLTLCLACVNVANLLLGRLVSRRSELALRLALGADRAHLVRQLLTESLLLAALGAAGGVALAFWATRLTRDLFAGLGSGIGIDARIDIRVLAVTLALAALTAVGFGLLPALNASRTGLVRALRAGRRDDRGGRRARAALVVAQVALAMVILVTAGMFVRSLQRAVSLDPGFDPGGVAIAAIDPSRIAMDETASRQLLDELMERLSNTPGFEVAGLTDRVPLGLGARFFENTVTVEIPGWEPPVGEDGFRIEHAAVSPGYLETLAIPVLEGRDFRAADDENGPAVAIANETFVERFFDGNEPLGQTLRSGERELTIVGVVRDSRYRTLDEQPTAFLYLPLAQHFGGSATLVARAARGAPAEPAIRDVVRGLAPHLPVDPEPFTRTLAISVLPQRIAGAVAGSLGAVGLFLTAVGLFGVLVYSVSRRTQEIGIRISLGAAPAQVRLLVLRQGLGMVLGGVVLGLPVALLVGRSLQSFLYGVSPFDPPTYTLVIGVLVAAGLVASTVPARRAARTDALSAIRSE